MTSKITTLCGWFLMVSLVLSVISSFTDVIQGFWAGIPVWIASLLFIPHVSTAQKKQVLLLLSVGGVSLCGGLIHQADIHYILKALEANQHVITMLVGVGFLKIVATNSLQTQEALPQGRRALVKTLLGAHLFGSVLNMSSVIIVGDKLATQRPINPLQGLLLLRAFCICAFWSPFFAAMGLTLVSSPGSQLGTLVLYGLPISLAGMLVSIWEIIKQPDARELHGYPMNLNSLWMPCLLAVLVIGTHELFPKISVLTLVSVTALLFTLIWLLITSGFKGLSLFIKHIESDVANARSEVVLFSAAALLAAGVAAILSSLNLHLAPAHFGPLEAGVTLVILVALAITGMHPVTSVVLAGSLLSPSVNDPNLLGLTLLMGWSLGIALSPFSGVQISIQSRYNISAKVLLKMNYRYGLIMLLLCFTLLWYYSVMVH